MNLLNTHSQEDGEINQKPEFDLAEIVKRLGFSESEEMEHTRYLLAEAIRVNNEPDRKQLHNDYSDQLEMLIGAINSPAAAIGAQIARASIYKEGGDLSRYVEDLEDVPEALSSIGLAEFAGIIENEIESYK